MSFLSRPSRPPQTLGSTRPRVRKDVDLDPDELPPWETRSGSRSKRRTEPAKKPAAKQAAATPMRKGFSIDQNDTPPPRRTTKEKVVGRSKEVETPKVTTELAIRQPSIPSRKEMRAIVKSTYGDKAEVILSMLDSESETDGAITLLARTLIQTLVSVLPLAEQCVRDSKGQKGIYQLNQLTSGIREMMMDVRAMREVGDVGARVVDRVLRPAWTDLAVQVMLAIATMTDGAKSRMTPEDFREYRALLEDQKLNLARFMTAQYNDVRDGVITSMS